MTNHWVDFKNSDVILVIGANPAENHPCGWKWAHVGRDERGTKIIHVDPRFTRTSAIADLYAPIRAGTDVAFFGGLINYVLSNELYHEDYVKLHTNASFIVSKEYGFEDGLFAGYDEEAREYDTTKFEYETKQPTGSSDQAKGGLSQTAQGVSSEATIAKQDPSLQHERSVFQLLKKHFERYTPEMVSDITGVPQEKFLEIAEIMGSTGVPERVGSVVYAVGLTHHTSGVQIIRGIGILQLLLGNVGRPGGGVNAERGHANIQGNTDNAISWEILPGYLRVPQPGLESLSDYIGDIAPAKAADNAVNYFGTKYKDFLVSLLKNWYGDAATKSNDFAYSYLPKPAADSSWLSIHDAARTGALEGIVSAGMSGVNIGPDSRRVIESLGKLKWFAIMDPLPTASSEFWRGPGVDPETVDTEVFFLPTTHWIEKDGSFTNSGRWAQWKDAAIPAHDEIKDDNWILGHLFLELRELYAKEGGAFPDPIENLQWNYTDPGNPSLDELAQEINGRDLKTGMRLATFDDLRDDGTTVVGNWIYSGSYPEEGNLMRRRGTDDPTGLGYFHEWAWSWPANRRVLYNRASADARGKPWDATRPGITWNGSLWVGDVPDFDPESPPSDGLGAFIMTAEGVARLFAASDLLKDGPFPEHYEQVESPLANPLSKTDKNPIAFLYEGAQETFAPSGGEFPYVATTYRVTEHEHYVTQHVPYLVEAMPDFFIELPIELAKEKGITNGGKVRVRSTRGEVEGVAMVTKRMRPLKVGQGKVVYQVGIPVHWHYAGGKNGGLETTTGMANMLTPYVGDANTFTPEFKGFLVDVERG